ncbi:MAG: hypothetical protein DMF66_19530 [Acidobacteria bacterium]|nr:MAG: hypothetical protein DMF66_19530 [Acidobacteriota bacterium]
MCAASSTSRAQRSKKRSRPADSRGAPRPPSRRPARPRRSPRLRRRASRLSTSSRPSRPRSSSGSPAARPRSAPPPSPNSRTSTPTRRSNKSARPSTTRRRKSAAPPRAHSTTCAQTAPSRSHAPCARPRPNAAGTSARESREKTYEAFSLLFLMAKAGEVQPLIRAIEGHPNSEVRLAVVKLLALSGQKEILPAFRRLAVRGSLPTEVRSAVMEAIYQISSSQSSAA